MKVILQDGRSQVLRFDKGEEVIAGLQNHMNEHRISACVFSGIGSCSEMELGYYNSHIKDYRRKPFLDGMEILSFSGNGGMKEGAPIVHAHGLFSGTDFAVIGGHVFKLVVSATCEIFLQTLAGEITRSQNADFNLNLLT